MLIYLIKLSVALSIVWLFYQLVLRRLTFYNSNRWYLLLYTAASFLIPFIDISVFLQKNDLSGAGMVELIPSMESYAGLTAQQQAPALATREPVMPWWMVVFLAGALLVFVRLLIQIFSMYRLRSKASLVSNEKVKLYQVDEAIAPFSFGNSIFVNQQLHDNEELKKIIRHEFVHVRQRHSVDVLWGEILCMLNWYNPFAWLIRRSIRQNLEFIADDQVLGSGVDKKQYQYLLLKVTGGTQFRIASQFNFSSLKKRIVMMNKVRTAKVHVLRFFFVLPLAAVLLLAFRSGMGRNSSDGEPRRGQEPIFSADTTKPVEFKDFKKRNPSVQSVSWMSNPYRVVIRLKDGTQETYNLENEAEKEKAVQKYGGLPEAPPPPPAPSAPAFSREPAAPKPVEVVDVKAPPAPPVEVVPPAEPAKLSIAAPPVPPPPAPPAEIISFEADEITFGSGRIQLRGNVHMKEEFNEEIIEIKRTNLVWDTNSLVMMDGEEVEQGKTYSGRFEVRAISIEEAQKKYGAKGKNGAVELKKVK